MMPSNSIFGFVIPLWSLVRRLAGTLGSRGSAAATSDPDVCIEDPPEVALESCPAWTRVKFGEGAGGGAVDAVGDQGAGAGAAVGGSVVVPPRGEPWEAPSCAGSVL